MLGEATHGTLRVLPVARAAHPPADRGARLLLRRGRGRLARLRPGAPLRDGRAGRRARPAASRSTFERWPTWMWANAEVARFASWLRALERGAAGASNGPGSTGSTCTACGSRCRRSSTTWARRTRSRWRRRRTRTGASSRTARVEEYGAASRFVSAPLRGGGGPAAGAGPANRPSPTARTASRPGRTRRWWPAPSATTGRWCPAGRSRGTSATATWQDTLDRLLDHYGPDARGRRLGAQHARRRRPGHRHGRRRDGQHRPAGPRAARRGRGGPGRLRQLPGHGDRRAPLGFAGRGDGGAAGPGGLDRAAAARADAGAGGADLRRRRPAGLGHRDRGPPGDRGGLRPVVRVAGATTCRPGSATGTTPSSGATTPPPCTRYRSRPPPARWRPTRPASDRDPVRRSWSCGAGPARPGHGGTTTPDRPGGVRRSSGSGRPGGRAGPRPRCPRWAGPGRASAAATRPVRPSSDMTAGTIVIRTTNASMATPMASAKPIDLMIGSSSRMKPAKTDDHDERGGGDHPGAVAHAADRRLLGGVAVHEVLPHPGDQEHLVVHGQAEQDADQQDRQEADQRAGRVQADQARPGGPAGRPRP